MCRSFDKLRYSCSLVSSNNVCMRRWMFMAALSATLLAVPLWGQTRGHGGMAMGGPRGGYVGGGFVGAPHGAYLGGGVHGRPGHLPYYPKRYPYFRYRYPWWGFRVFYNPWWLGWYGGINFVGSDPSSSDPAASNPAYANPSPDNSRAYEQQQEIDRLNDEVARLRAERAPTNPTLESSPKIQA